MSNEKKQNPVVQYVLNAEDLRGVLSEFVGEVLSKNQEKPKERFLSPVEVSTLLNVSRSTLWRWRKENYLRPVKVGAKVVYRESAVRKLMGEG